MVNKTWVHGSASDAIAIIQMIDDRNADSWLRKTGYLVWHLYFPFFFNFFFEYKMDSKLVVTWKIRSPNSVWVWRSNCLHGCGPKTQNEGNFRDKTSNVKERNRFWRIEEDRSSAFRFGWRFKSSRVLNEFDWMSGEWENVASACASILRILSNPSPMARYANTLSRRHQPFQRPSRHTFPTANK